MPGRGPPALERERAGVPLSLSAAVRSALRQHPSLLTAQRQLDLARADLLAAHGPFDTNLIASLARSHAVDPFSKSTTNTTQLSLGANKAFRWGMRVDTNVGLTGQTLRPEPELGPPSIQVAAVSLNVTQPLLRNAGTVGAASAITGGVHLRRASEEALRFAAQLQVFQVIVSYWGLVAAEQALALFEDSESRAQKILDETRVLVNADQRPRGDLRALEGNLANRRRAVIAGHNQRLQALSALRLAMGLDMRERVEWTPVDAFPGSGPLSVSLPLLTERALAARADLKAAQARVAGAAAIERGADHNTLPEVDLSVGVGYAGGLERSGVGPFFGSLGHAAGVNASAAVSVQLPLENSAQQAEHQRGLAQLRLAEIELFDLTRTLRGEVAQAFDDLRLSMASLGAASEAELQYDQALGDERYKLRAGLSTVINVVLTEDLLTQATRDRIDTQLQVAVALAQLRFAVGELPASENAVQSTLPGVMKAGASDGE